jgi:hypothetical protein
MSQTCTHLSTIRTVTPSALGCEECLKIAGRSNFAVFSHTDLGRKGDFPERFRRIRELADPVVIDEAHHFRNTGTRGRNGAEPSRYYRLYELLDGAVRPKSVFMLTATPINNRVERLPAHGRIVQPP